MTFMPRFQQTVTEFPFAYPVNHEAELLTELSRQGLSRLLVGHDIVAPQSVYEERLAAELLIIKDNEFCSYFLIVADYVQWAKDNDIAVGPGRGSGPCSLVGFALGITTVDPIKYDLPFERFVNPNKQSLPDFDLDFCDERCHEVTAYIQKKYGVDRVAQISSEDTVPMPSRLVICDRPLAELVSLYTNPNSGFPVARMNLAQIADAGLVRFNVINQKALTIIQRTVRELAASGTEVNIDKIALDDSDAYRLLSKGEASNIPVLGDQHYKSTLLAIKPDRFEDLCAVIALCQPRSHSVIPLFIERKRNPSLVRHIHPALESITVDTYGLVLYQEQVMRIAHTIAGYSMADADSFRRALKKSSRNDMDDHKKQFSDGAIKFGMSGVEAVDLFDLVAKYNQCSFTKAHAVAYAMIAYQSAWLKANYSHDS